MDQLTAYLKQIDVGETLNFLTSLFYKNINNNNYFEILPNPVSDQIELVFKNKKISSGVLQIKNTIH